MHTRSRPATSVLNAKRIKVFQSHLFQFLTRTYLVVKLLVSNVDPEFGAEPEELESFSGETNAVEWYNMGSKKSAEACCLIWGKFCCNSVDEEPDCCEEGGTP